MKKMLLLCLLAAAVLRSGAQGFAGAEYFFDTDPGIGNGIALAASSSNDTISLNTNISTTGLSNGFHFLGLRIQQSDGTWGLFEKRGFYIAAAVPNVTNITAAEYFVDTDPGVGNGVAILVSTGATISFPLVLPTATLGNGFHFVAIRAKDADGRWGLFEKRGFYIETATSASANIDATEYFFDTDPGVGNGIAITPITAGSTVNFVAAIPSLSLSSGFHLLNIRARASDGRWGLFSTRGFYISPTNNDVTDIVAAEYFIDTDPGVGNGSSLTVNAPGATVTENFVCSTPAGISNGDHLLLIRVQDAAGHWGLFEMDSFLVTTVLSLTGLELEASNQGAGNILNWFTMSEQNASHFEIEKSGNGIQFSKLGQAQAAGNSTTKSFYRFIDKAPFDGVNYYRIKAFNKDGSFEYSNIATVLNNMHDQQLKIYPNPAKQMINIATGNDKDQIVQLFGGAGQLISTRAFKGSDVKLDITILSPGKYYVRISDGATIMNGSFIKN
jgi:hypothetical protein